MNRSKRVDVAVSRSKRHQRQLIQPLIFLLLFANVATHRDFVPPHRGDPIATRPELLAHKAASPPRVHPRYVDRRFPFQEPTTCPTEYFGGIEISLCT